MAEARPAEVRPTEVCGERLLLFLLPLPPSVPGIDTLPEDFQVVWIGHLGRLSMGRRLATKIGVGLVVAKPNATFSC
jgi:hypothetical protein